MKLQTDKAFMPIPISGCYFACWGDVAEKVCSKKFTDNQFLKSYAQSIIDGCMDPNCYVNSPEGLFLILCKELGFRVKFGTWWQPAGDDPKEPFDYQIFKHKTKTGAHFTGEDYNPDPRVSVSRLLTIRYIKVHSVEPIKK